VEKRKREGSREDVLCCFWKRYGGVERIFSVWSNR